MIQRSDCQKKALEVIDPQEPRVSPPGKGTSMSRERLGVGVLAASGSIGAARVALR